MTEQQPQQRRVSVAFKKQLNDGQYGSETAEVYLEEFLYDMYDDAEAAEFIVGSLNRMARRLVNAQLQESPSLRVRLGLKFLGEAKKADATAATVPPDEEPL